MPRTGTPRQIIVRSGSQLVLDDLARVDFSHASVIVAPAADSYVTDAVDADTRTVKTRMTLGAALEEAPPQELPLMVVEIQDPRHATTLRKLYKGPMGVIAGDEIIAGQMVQTSPGRHAFIDRQRAADARGEIAMAIRWAAKRDQPHGYVELNPARDAILELNDDDELIVLSTA